MRRFAKAKLGWISETRDSDLGLAAMKNFEKKWNPTPSREAKSTSSPRFLILNHFYDQDIQAFLLADFDCGIWVLNQEAVAGIRAFFGEGSLPLTVDSNGPEMANQVNAARLHFARPAVERMLREVRPDAVITPSSVFYWFRPFMQEFQRAGVPVIVQDKEGTLVDSPIIDITYELIMKNYPPLAEAYFFWGDNQANKWAQAGMQRSAMRLLGMPRSDFFNHPERFPTPTAMGLPEGKKIVTFFTFEANVYLKFDFQNIGINRPWLQLRREIHEEIVSMAKSRPDLHFVVKCHPQSPEVDEIRSELDEKLANLTVMTGASTAASLVVLSEVVIGFQTTALIETMLTDKPIVYAGWAEEHSKFYQYLIPIPDSGACYLPSNRGEFRKIVEDLVDGREKTSATMHGNRASFAARYFANPDGRTAERILRQIVREFVPRLN